MKFTLLVLATAFTTSALAQDSSVYAALNNRAKDRGLVVIMGEAARQAFDLLEMPAREKTLKTCSFSTDGSIGPHAVQKKYEIKMGTNITCERNIASDTYQCFLPFNVKDGGKADKTVQTLDFPC